MPQFDQQNSNSLIEPDHSDEPAGIGTFDRLMPKSCTV